MVPKEKEKEKEKEEKEKEEKEKEGGREIPLQENPKSAFAIEGALRIPF